MKKQKEEKKNAEATEEQRAAESVQIRRPTASKARLGVIKAV